VSKHPVVERRRCVKHFEAMSGGGPCRMSCMLTTGLPVMPRQQHLLVVAAGSFGWLHDQEIHKVRVQARSGPFRRRCDCDTSASGRLSREGVTLCAARSTIGDPSSMRRRLLTHFEPVQ